MKKTFYPPIFAFLFLISTPARADFWGGDIPLLAKIVTNTLYTMNELRKQTGMLNDELAGINDRINRVQAIAEMVQPSSWDKWKDPEEALRRLKFVYYTLPKEYRSAKSDEIEDELSKAMTLIAKVSKGSASSFQSGKEMERRGADASPGVAQKLTASGVGTLITMEAQSQVIQSHIVSLLAESIAEANEKEARSIETRGTAFASFSQNMGTGDSLFSRQALSLKATP